MDQKKTYEGMFLLDAGKSDFEAASEPIRTVLERYGAEILSLKPWEERRLAYPIKGRRRGAYALTYFKADPSRISEIEHDFGLNEDILRVLILRREHLSEDVINAETPSMIASREAKQRQLARETRAAEAQAAESQPPTAAEPAPVDEAAKTNETEQLDSEKTADAPRTKKR